MQTTEITPSEQVKVNSDSRALRILAKSVYRELKSGGYTHGDIVSFTNQLLELVSSEIKDDRRS